MNNLSLMVSLTASAPWAIACNLIDDEPGTVSGDDTGGLSGAEACAKEFEAMLELGCPPGSYPWQDFDGGTSTIVQLDDPGARVGLGVGLVVHFGGGVGADWVGYHVTQNATCSTACLLPSSRAWNTMRVPRARRGTTAGSMRPAGARPALGLRTSRTTAVHGIQR